MSFQPIIWRSAHSDFNRDEPLQAPSAYPAEVLAAIRAHGFDAVWLRGRLLELMDSAVFPRLNDPHRAERIANLRDLIARARRHGLGVYLYFNEPLALAEDHPFWSEHPDWKGEPFTDPLSRTRYYGWCTSLPEIKRFVRQAIASTLGALDGLAGVILITNSENHTHCWSHHITRPYDDGFVRTAPGPLGCERCRQREPADIVGELVSFWREAAPPSLRLLAWNWSWSFWYEEPQAEVIRALPAGAELMVDWERGGRRRWREREILVDEYSLSFAGPSERALGSIRAARGRGLPVHAKLQIGTTHEIATVPNLPLLGNLHAKCCRLHEAGIAGAMASWNFGTLLTLNTFAFGLFWRDPSKYADAGAFYDAVAREYFGLDTGAALGAAWQGFGEAFQYFPFSTPMVYHGPVNRAPAWPLTLSVADRPLPPSWMAVPQEWGERLEDCLGGFTLNEVVDGFAELARGWERQLPGYLAALKVDAPGAEELRRHRFEEASTARMIGHQMRSTAHVFAFHRWRGTGRERLDGEGREIVRAELDNVRAALALVRADPRLGVHLEAQAHLYDVPRLEAKITALEWLLAEGPPGHGPAGP